MQANLNKFQTELIKLSLSKAELSISLIVITVLAIAKTSQVGVQPALPPGVHKLKLIKSLLKALQSLSLFTSPVFQPKELILATLVS